MERPFGIYVHVPFCAARCDYCAFATWTDRDPLMAAYAEACATELGRATRAEGLPAATSVYVGGGTPSRLPAELLAGVLEAVVRSPGAEVTVECNPEDASAERFARWRAAGVTRVSFGVQSMVPHVLEALGRRHGTTQVARAVALAAESGIPAVNVDLILGAATETDADLAATLEAVLALDPRPRHVSAYALTVEPGTALARDPARHPDDDACARRYAMVDAALSAAGYRWYEVSNWAVPGHECRHNALYWAQGDYRGIGCAAHSHRGGRRWWNTRTPERYIEAVRAGRRATAGDEVLSEGQRAFEGLALALRTSAGVPASAVPDDPDLDGLVERRGDRAVLTVRGRLLANEVTVRLRTQESTVRLRTQEGTVRLRTQEGTVPLRTDQCGALARAR
ncbi:MAG TPA: radical SAM family heme chaperone HemW [Acidimicrobiales bacterium]|nr:radical SAM family heme chaperone HemW [Acidimicrobiales bacterium]